MDAVVDVLKSSAVLLGTNYDVFVGISFAELDIGCCAFSCLVLGSIVDYDNLEVDVLLLEN